MLEVLMQQRLSVTTRKNQNFNLFLPTYPLFVINITVKSFPCTYRLTNYLCHHHTHPHSYVLAQSLDLAIIWIPKFKFPVSFKCSTQPIMPIPTPLPIPEFWALGQWVAWGGRWYGHFCWLKRPEEMKRRPKFVAQKMDQGHTIQIDFILQTS